MSLEEPCLEWDGARGRGGYGRYMRYGRSRYLHLIVWEAAFGPVPEGGVVMHLCDNPACYRLAHLRLGTQAENVADMVAKGRGLLGRSKYSAEVRARILADPRSSRELGVAMGMSDSTIRKIRRTALVPVEAP